MTVNLLTFISLIAVNRTLGIFQILKIELFLCFGSGLPFFDALSLFWLIYFCLYLSLAHDGVSSFSLLFYQRFRKVEKESLNLSTLVKMTEIRQIAVWSPPNGGDTSIMVFEIVFGEIKPQTWRNNAKQKIS